MWSAAGLLGMALVRCLFTFLQGYLSEKASGIVLQEATLFGGSIRAHLRQPRQPFSFLLESGDLALDLRTRRATRGEAEVDLTSREFSVLEFFLRHTGQVLSRSQLLNGVWGYTFDPGSNVVNVYVGYLRGKLDRPGEASVIETVRGGGYRLRDGTRKETTA